MLFLKQQIVHVHEIFFFFLEKLEYIVFKALFLLKCTDSRGILNGDSLSLAEMFIVLLLLFAVY